MYECAEENFIDHAVETYSDMILRIAFQRLRNMADSEDVMQDVFLNLIRYPKFFSELHLKAWIIRATINKCKDYLKMASRKRTVPLESVEFSLTTKQQENFDELERLPAEDRDILYLFYFEDYPANEIAKIFRIKEGAVFARLTRARNKLKKIFLEET